MIGYKPVNINVVYWKLNTSCVLSIKKKTIHKSKGVHCPQPAEHIVSIYE